jgi:hypothetical protein
VRVRSITVFSLGLALGVAGTAFVGVVVLDLTPAPVPAAVASPASEWSRSSAGPSGSAASSARDLREAVNASVSAALAENRRGYELDLYLEALERAARERGNVSALEVVPGLAAIDAAYPNDAEKGPAFARRMEELARKLGQSTQGADDPPPGVTAHSLLHAVSSTPAGPARDKLIPQALTAISRLPVAEQEEASKALDRATAEGVVPKPAARAPDELLALVASTTEATARGQLVREFMDATSSLPLEEQERRYRALDRATAAASGGLR